jgi:N utilization substance protein A
LLAHLLIAEGFSNVDEIAMVNTNELAEIEGFDEEIAAELQRRAKEYVEKRNQEFAEKSKKMGLDEKLQTIEGLDKDMLMTLADNNIRTIDDLADLASDELIEILGADILSVNEAEKVIMAARAHWFKE